MATFEELGKVDRSIGIEYEDPRLLRQHKIFLSHSGVQKEFVEQLCVDLESYCRFPFFDKRPSSLPKGERFPNLIKAVVAQCEMMVVVVSNTYFTSKWPMIELHGFKQASKGKENLKKILPLFYGLNVDEFFDTKRQEKWFKKWETMAIADDRIKVGEWKECLKWFGGFNGIVYDRHSKEVVAYRKEIVSNICKAIPPDIKYDESHVQGRSKLCQVICGFFGNTPNSTKIPGVRVIGLYGLGGMGKTETCKMMCNEMDGEFDGKVCYLELGKTSKHELVKKLLTTLTTTIAEVVQEVGEDKLRRLVDSALLEHAEMSSGEVSIHDLYLEFAGLEAQGKLIALDMEKRRWVYAKDAHPTELVEEPKSSWNMLTRVCISDAYRMMKKSGITSLRAIKWKYFTNLVVLKLDDLYELSEVLNFKDLIRLRSLIVKTSVFSLFNFSIEGLEGLKTLNYFKMHCGGEDTKAYVGKLPAALKVLVVSGSVVLVRDVFDLCTNLVSLKLGSVYTSDLDLRSCTSLQKVELIKIHGLGTLDLVPSIQSLNISCCPKLSQVCGLKRLAGLLSLVVIGNEKLLLLSNFPVRTLECVGLESLTISDCPELSTLPRLTSIQCLRELEISRVGLTKIPNLSGLEQLEVIDASRNSELTSLQGIGDLRALKTINLSSCESLFRLSDMSKLTNLKVLDLRFTRVELQEEDIHMLEKLQVLEPVLVARPPRNRIVPTFGLDFKRHKILYLLSESFENYEGWQTCKKSGWEEKDLHYPFGAGYPVGRGIKIRNVENLWRLIPGPVIKIVGPDGKH